MKLEFDIDPTIRMDLIPVAQDCPKNLLFVVRWLKGLVLFQEADLVADRDKLLLILHECVNSPHWPPKTIWELSMTKERVALIYDRACEWIFAQEKF